MKTSDGKTSLGRFPWDWQPDPRNVRRRQKKEKNLGQMR